MESPCRCSVRLCRSAATSDSPITCQPLCVSHLQNDFAELDALEASVAERIHHFKAYRAPMRLMQQRLASDLQLLDDSFAELRETLDRCQSELCAVVTKQHDELMVSLSSVSELEDSERELKQAKNNNNMRQVFLVNRSLEASLRTLQLDSKLVRMDEDEGEVELVAYPDLNSSVRELQNAVKSELTMLKKYVEQIDVSDSVRCDKIQLKANESRKEAKLQENEIATCLTLCNNTAGFVIHDSDIVKKSAEHSTDPSRLPQPSIFVAVEVEVASESSNSEADTRGVKNFPESKILLLSPDADIVGRLACSWEADQPIRDLHCDNERQLLFIAQEQAVTVTDLSGAHKSRICITELHESTKKLYCIAGNCDKLFALIKEQSDDLTILGLNKDSNQIQMTFPVPHDCELIKKDTRMAVRDRMLILSDRCDVFTICTITEKLVCCRSFKDDIWISFFKIEDNIDRVFTITGSQPTSADFNLFRSISFLVRLPLSKKPRYTLTADGETEFKLVQIKGRGVLFITWQLDPERQVHSD